MAKYKANKKYNELENKDNFVGKGSASTHEYLKAGLTIEINPKLFPLSKLLEDSLIEVKKKEKK